MNGERLALILFGTPIGCLLAGILIGFWIWSC